MYKMLFQHPWWWPYAFSSPIYSYINELMYLKYVSLFFSIIESTFHSWKDIWSQCIILLMQCYILFVNIYLCTDTQNDIGL